MKSRWRDREARRCAGDPLALRVYTSRLLGQEPTLVLHGGGNTSVKLPVRNLFGEVEEILYVKGSGGDLKTIGADGFAPVRLDVARRMATLARLSDTEMVRAQRAAMINPAAPNPSVEAILHAVIPFRYVDHTHADAVVTITNTADGARRIRRLYGDRVLIVPYVMPGFLLSRKVYEMTRGLDWSRCEALVLLHHGVFTFGDEARVSYERMIRVVSVAETYLRRHGANGKSGVRGGRYGVGGRWGAAAGKRDRDGDLRRLARLRRAVSKARGAAMIARWDDGTEAVAFSSVPNVAAIATRGPITPDHVIRTKPMPALVGDRPETAIERFAAAYRRYFARHTDGRLTCLDPAPRWAVWRGLGTVAFGRNAQEVGIVADIVRHTIRAIRHGEALGGWRPLPPARLFEVEYWELEQAKLKKAAAALPLQGRVALVTGAASGIGRACAEALRDQGAVVAALDVNQRIALLFKQPEIIGIVCDVTDSRQVEAAVRETVRRFGGLDLVISNAGIFPESQPIAELTLAAWRRSLAVNLSSHEQLLQACIPYLSLGLEPSVVIIASKNVAAPGPGAAAYSVAKAGLTQLGRVAALELAADGIRVNVLHPDQVFDTGLWTPAILASRAKRYGISVEEYKSRNLLRVRVTSRDVAQLACAMAGPLFAKTTGAQVPIDGGNERVI